MAPADPANGVETGAGTPPGDPGERIACAIGGAAMTQTCAVERSATDGGTLVTIRHPDGGFRRLRISKDGVRVADGAQPARVTIAGSVADVAVGEARYRLPLARP